MNFLLSMWGYLIFQMVVALVLCAPLLASLPSASAWAILIQDMYVRMSSLKNNGWIAVLALFTLANLIVGYGVVPRVTPPLVAAAGAISGTIEEKVPDDQAVSFWQSLEQVSGLPVTKVVNQEKKDETSSPQVSWFWKTGPWLWLIFTLLATPFILLDDAIQMLAPWFTAVVVTGSGGGTPPPQGGNPPTPGGPQPNPQPSGGWLQRFFQFAKSVIMNRYTDNLVEIGIERNLGHWFDISHLRRLLGR